MFEYVEPPAGIDDVACCEACSHDDMFQIEFPERLACGRKKHFTGVYANALKMQSGIDVWTGGRNNRCVSCTGKAEKHLWVGSHLG